MLPIDTYLDRILKHLSWNRKDFEAIDTLFSKYDVPKEIQESLVNTLKHHNHIETKKFIGERDYAKITDEGYAFITSTCYKDSSLTRIANVSSEHKMEYQEGVQRHITMAAESGVYNLNRPVGFKMDNTSPINTPNEKLIKDHPIIAMLKKYWWAIVIPLVVGIILLYIEHRFLK
jgi:hypothetical protein